VILGDASAAEGAAGTAFLTGLVVHSTRAPPILNQLVQS